MPQSLQAYLLEWDLPTTTESQLAYFAGFFDGEGCIQFRPPSKAGRQIEFVGGLSVFANVVNNSRRSLEELRLHFGGNIYDKPLDKARYPLRNRSYYWLIAGRQAAYFLSQITPFLRVKRQQAEAAVLFAETLYNGWRHMGRAGWPLTSEALHLRRIAFRGFRNAIASVRPLSWDI